MSTLDALSGDERDRLAEVLARKGRHINRAVMGRFPRPADEVDPRGCPLTARKVEILRLVADGHRDKQIADALGVSIETIKTQVKSMLTFAEPFLAGRNRTALAVYAVRQGWID